MTQSEEFPAEPVPTEPQPVPSRPVPAQPAAEAPQVPAEWAQQAPAEAQPQPGSAPVQTWPQPVDPAAQGGQVAAFGYTPMPSPEELAAAAAKKAKRRAVFAKSAIIAVPAIVLVALLAGTSIEAGAYTSKSNAAATAAKAATAASGLSDPLTEANAAAQGSILVDGGCVAVESQATTNFETKLYKDSDNLDKTVNGSSLTAYIKAVDTYIHDLQAFSTGLQQDAALSKRDTVKTAVGLVSKDIGVIISAMQAAESGDFSNSVFNRLDATANRIDGDSTAVDTMCGGTILDGGGGSSDGAGGLVA